MGGPGQLGSLQKSLGLDVLEFTSDSAGSGAAAGKYVSDKVYLGVKQTTSGTSRAVIDLDITETIKTKGEFGSDGSSKISIGVDLDYRPGGPLKRPGRPEKPACRGLPLHPPEDGWTPSAPMGPAATCPGGG